MLFLCGCILHVCGSNGMGGCHAKPNAVLGAIHLSKRATPPDLASFLAMNTSELIKISDHNVDKKYGQELHNK